MHINRLVTFCASSRVNNVYVRALFNKSMNYSVMYYDATLIMTSDADFNEIVLFKDRTRKKLLTLLINGNS